MRKNRIFRTKPYPMKRIISLLLGLAAWQASAQSGSLPADYVRDSLPVLVGKCEKLLESAYMAQTLLGETDTIPGWEGFPVQLYEYRTGKDIYKGAPKVGKVYLLNPSPEKLAMWIATTCLEVKGSPDARYTDKLLNWIRGQSGAQFPVKGVVYEDMYTPGYYEPYIFKDGVTVYVADSTQMPADKTCTPEQLEYYLNLDNSQLKPQTGRYGRICSTTREQYRANGGTEDVGDGEHRKQAWLDVVRRLYQQAWRSDRNELMIAWARENL